MFPGSALATHESHGIGQGVGFCGQSACSSLRVGAFQGCDHPLERWKHGREGTLKCFR